jgi:hypothetical protein
VINHLEDQNHIVVYYFLNNNKFPNQTSVLREFLAQLLGHCQNIPANVQASIDQLSSNENEFGTISDLILLFALWVQQLPPVYVILDGLDECGTELLEAMLSLSEEFVRTSIRVLISSRSSYRGYFQGRVPNIWTVTLKTHGESDIYKYIAGRIAEAGLASTKLGAMIEEKLLPETL